MNKINKFDLHMHSNFSDGQLTPEQLLQACSEQGLQVVSVTDHDTTDHIEPSLIAGKKMGIKVIPGSELSIEHKSYALHLLAYNFDPASNELKKRLDSAKQERKQRVASMVNALQQQGFTIEAGDVYKVAGDSSIGRPHVALAAMARKENATMMQKLGIRTIHDFFDLFLAEGRPAYFTRTEKFTANEAISLIHRIGGIGVLAHPACHFHKEPEHMGSVIHELADIGLDGIEVFSKQNSRKTTRELHRLARTLNLRETAGCDFHRPNDDLLGSLGDWHDFGMKPNLPSGF
jgi:predicted metal-dependent phosphoesterase TrpH